MTSLTLDWFNRRCGQWRSERRYMFKPDGDPVIYTTMMDIYRGDHYNEFVIDWTGKTEGQMVVQVEGDLLRRSRDYMGPGAHDSVIQMLDADTMVTSTTYDGVTFREEIRLISQDSYTLRQTFGTKADGSFALAGQYLEFRLP